jgi:hypothetical protein
VFKKAMIAAVVGATCGAAAGYWSKPGGTRNEPPEVSAATVAPVAASARPVTRPPAEPAPEQPQPQSQQRTRTEPASSGADDSRDAAQRARVLARLPDIKSLVALREEVLRRAKDAGEGESPATTRELDEIDRYLGEARVLRLKLDADEFRKGAARRNPPR